MATPLPATQSPATTPTSPRWQCSLRELMVAMLVLSLYFGATYWLGPCMGILGGVGLTIAALAYTGRRRITAGEMLLGGLVVICSMGLLLPTISMKRSTPSPSACFDNLKQITMAMQMYAINHGEFPPAYIADADGKPMHSWRVLILRELGRGDLYAAYSFEEPWDGPNNRRLHSPIESMYRCRSDRSRPATQTSYVAVTGPGTIFPGDKSTPASQVKAAATTLLLVEVHNSGIHWMEPRDLDVNTMAKTINPKSGVGISSVHPHGAHAAFVDGHVEFLPDSLSAEQLRARITIAGGEKVEE